MKQKHLAMLAACVFGVMGGSAFGDDHHPPGGGDDGPEPGGPSNCEMVPPGCMTECLLAEDACAGGESTPLCRMRRAALDLCALTPPPDSGGGGGGGGGECGDDEIGGGSEECEACGEGEVPNEDGTACETCEHGEFEAGECASLCSNSALDSAASWSLRGIPREPWEQLESYTCDSGGHMHIEWLGSSQHDRDVCEVEADGSVASSAYGHSHPHFVWPRDRGVFCHDFVIRRSKDVTDWNCKHGAKFGGPDKSGAKTRQKPIYLIVPEREQVEVYRKTGATGFWGGSIWDEEIVWSAPQQTCDDN